MNNDQFPKTNVTATDVLSNHRFDEKKYKPMEKKKSNNTEDNSTVPTTVTSFAQSGLGEFCYCCGQKGHKSPECPEKESIPRSEWAYKKLQNHLQEIQRGDDVSLLDDDTQSQATGRGSTSQGRKLTWRQQCSWMEQLSIEPTQHSGR